MALHSNRLAVDGSSQQADIILNSVAADYLHVVELESKLNDDQLAVLKQLLVYGPAETGAVPTAISDGSNTIPLEIIVAPRAGTISPWSSKATDITHNCGLSIIIESSAQRFINLRLVYATQSLPRALKIKLSVC